MSKFARDTVNGISPYVPGEQPRDKKYIKLNTNENPYYTSEKAVKRIDKSVLEELNRYSDPENVVLTKTIADYYGKKPSNVLVTNGSDEALAFAFIAYGGAGVCYPDVTYGFYDVIANLFGCKVEHIKLNNDFTINIKDYFNKDKTVIIANPNAQTGIELSTDEVEEIIKNNPDNVVIVDRAYGDFGSADIIPLTEKYKNLLVVNTFSKSRSLAGARVGYAIADEKLIEDVKKVKNSFHPYNVNSVSALLAAEAIEDDGYFKESVGKVVKGRELLTSGLERLGFTVLPSSANFVLAKSVLIGGEELYLKLKACGVLVRYFHDERIKDFVRITVGTESEVAALINETEKLLKEKKDALR